MTDAATPARASEPSAHDAAASLAERRALRDCVFMVLGDAVRAAAAALKAELAPTGLTNTQAYVLCELAFAEPRRASALAEATRMEAATLTGVLERLEGKGLLRRTPAPDDRRSVEVRLTDDGRALARRAEAAMTRAEADVTARLGANGMAGLRASLGTLLDA